MTSPVSRTALALACALLGSLLMSAGASAKTINPYVYSGTSFNGSDSTAGTFERPAYVAINHANGNLYVLDAGHGGVLSQFTSSGVALPFTAPGLSGASSIVLGSWQGGNLNIVGGAGVSVDNSGTSTQGNIFVMHVGILEGLLPSGADISQKWPTCGNCNGGTNWIAPNGYVATDPSGTPWITSESAFSNDAHTVNPIDISTGRLSETTKALLIGKPFDTILGGNGQCCIAGSAGFSPNQLTFDSQGNLYVVISSVKVCNAGCKGIVKYDKDGKLIDPHVTRQIPDVITNNTADGQLAIDQSNDNLFVSFEDHIEIYDPQGRQVDSFVAAAKSTGVAINPTTHDAYVTNNAGSKIDVYKPGPSVVVPTIDTGPAKNVTKATATLTGTIDPDNGGNTTECFFEVGLSSKKLEKVVPCVEGSSLPSAGGLKEVTANLSDLNCEFPGSCPTFFPFSDGTNYLYRLVTKNAAGPRQAGRLLSFRNAEKPSLGEPTIAAVNADGATVEVSIDPEGEYTAYKVEFGPNTSYGESVEGELDFGFSARPEVAKDMDIIVNGLQPNTAYHYKVVAKNAVGETETTDRTFRTFPASTFSDSCANALSRQQTGAAQLLDCRSYEIASAADQGGYSVVSDLVPGAPPFAGYPQADDRLLYATEGGGVPNVGSPTNHGPDPYLATRGADGWTTKYVGIPGDNPFASGPFASTLAGADSALTTFAFAGPDICDPCFADGSAGIPVRLPSGELVQGMSGSLPVADPTPAGEVRKAVSDDGTHFVFGSEDEFEADANPTGVTIYLKDLQKGTTEVVSKTAGGATMSGSDIVALDVSHDGSRVLIGEWISEDAEGNDYFHLYMNVGGANSSIDLTAGTTTGALYSGMSADGTAVYFTSKDPLTTAADQDTDGSADLFRADVSSSSATLSRVSTGIEATGDTDACVPASDWNTPSGGPNCDVVAIAGGGGVADDGSVFFFSPEKLDGSADGTAGQPNLYRAEPGTAPHFVVTLEIANPVVEHAIEAAATADTADFQVDASGGVAVFTTILALKPDFENRGHPQVYAYEVKTDDVICISCAPTNAPSGGRASLPSDGLAITDDGRIFFNSIDPLALRDSNEKQDAYEWKNGVVELISSGTNENDSSLLSVSADGIDAFFFTREKLAPHDLNGPVLKVYDARVAGGFFVSPPTHPCKAADECHGAGTVQAPPARTQSTQGSEAQVRPKPKPKSCRKPLVKKRGKCVRKKKGHGGKRKAANHNSTRRNG